MRTNTPADVWARVEIGEEGECWPWLGGRRPNGYGQMTINYRNRSTHRVVYELLHGHLPSGMFVCHSCDNPPCCNPAHLFLGTPADNSRDRDDKGRHYSRAGALHPQAKLSAVDVARIRMRRAAGEAGTALAAEFGVAQQTICNIVKGRRYKR